MELRAQVREQPVLSGEGETETPGWAHQPRGDPAAGGQHAVVHTVGALNFLLPSPSVLVGQLLRWFPVLYFSVYL